MFPDSHARRYIYKYLYKSILKMNKDGAKALSRVVKSVVLHRHHHHYHPHRVPTFGAFSAYTAVCVRTSF